MSPENKERLRYHAMHTDSPLWEKIDEVLKTEIGRRFAKKTNIDKANRIAECLFEEFPDVWCALNFKSPFELLVATILSAQCTDYRVNKVTADLFKKYKKPADYIKSNPGELEEDVRSTGFFNNKAKSIRETARIVVEEFGGEIPVEMEKLRLLRGAARKTANVVRMHAFGLPGLSVDTHYTRITNRLGLTKATNAEKIEFETAALFPPEQWTHFADAVILHGRKTCNARKPKCDECRLFDLCPSAGNVVVAPPKKKAPGKKT
jgi:endonuclease III